MKCIHVISCMLCSLNNFVVHLQLSIINLIWRLKPLFSASMIKSKTKRFVKKCIGANLKFSAKAKPVQDIALLRTFSIFLSVILLGPFVQATLIHHCSLSQTPYKSLIFCNFSYSLVTSQYK